VYFQGKTRYYPIDLYLTEKEFAGATVANPKKAYMEYHEMLEGIKEKAKAARDSLTIFSFEAFEKKGYMTASQRRCAQLLPQLFKRNGKGGEGWYSL
jgi:hypothetical protein